MQGQGRTAGGTELCHAAETCRTQMQTPTDSSDYGAWFPKEPQRGSLEKSDTVLSALHNLALKLNTKKTFFP